jgi:hypothetical protein
MPRIRGQHFPPLEVMRGRWALAAAIETAILGENNQNARADRHGWFYSDGGGSWARLTPLADGRAVLSGIDRDYSETHRAGVDPTAGLPDWAVEHVEAAVRDESGSEWSSGDEQPWLGFVSWLDRGEADWRTVDHGVADGLDRHLLPALSEQRMLDAADDWFQGAAMELDDPESAPERVDTEAVLRAAQLGPGLTRDALVAVLPFEGMRVEAALRAARAFANGPAA